MNSEKNFRNREERITFALSFEKKFSLQWMKLEARKEDLPNRELYKGNPQAWLV